VVTRYFGGTKLGTGGLIRAYGTAVSAAVDRAGIVERRPLHTIAVTVAHAESGRVKHALRGSLFGLASVSYNADDVTLVVRLAPERRGGFQSWLAELTGGRGVARETGIDLIEVPVEASAR